VENQCFTVDYMDIVQSCVVLRETIQRFHVCILCEFYSDQPMDGGSLFGGGMLSGLGGQPSTAKASTNVFGAVQPTPGYYRLVLFLLF